MDEKKYKYIIGIDLGTTNSAVSIYENGEPKIIENLLGKRTTPSIIALKKAKDKKTGEVTSEWMVGESAKRQAVTNPLSTLYGVKRLIGRRFDDPEVVKMKSLAPYEIVAGPNGDAWVKVDGKAMAPAEISAKVLRDLKKAVGKYMGLTDEEIEKEVMGAVITVPAYFNNSQRQATKDAGKIAGLDVLRIINEPTAAALAYGMDKKKDGKVIVYDLGGGTFDVSVLDLSVSGEDGSMIQVLSTNGDTFLGGENFDERIMDHLVEVAKAEYGVDLKATKDVQALQRLKDAAEKAKIELSIQEMSEINLPFLARNDDGETVNFEYPLTRKKLEDLLKDLIEKTIDPCKKALADAGLKASDIDDVILVGGQTRMPKVIETVRNFFGKEPRKDVNPDEIVSMGATLQGAIIDGKVENVLLIDVIPLSIGIRTAGDNMAVMVGRNSAIPTTVSSEFYTAEDNQPNISVQVYQGERAKASDNKLLGKFIMRLPPGTKKETPIEVGFNIDADGVLEVSAKNKLTGAVQKITVQANGGLSEDQVNQMLKEAEANAEKDRLFKESQMAGIHAEEQLKEAKLDETEDYFLQAPSELQEQFHATVKELTEAVATKDIPAMLEKTKKLQEVRSAIGEAFTNAAQQQAAPEDDTPKADAAAPDQPEGPTPPTP